MAAIVKTAGASLSPAFNLKIMTPSELVKYLNLEPEEIQDYIKYQATDYEEKLLRQYLKVVNGFSEN